MFVQYYLDVPILIFLVKKPKRPPDLPTRSGPSTAAHAQYHSKTISDTRPPCLKNQTRGATDHQADTPCANTV